MKFSTYVPISTAQATSTGTGDVHTLTIPARCSAALITVETTAARVTLDGSAPGAGNGLVFPIALSPVLVPIGPGTTIKFASSAAGNSIVDVAYLQ